jgi:AcrR family transcriptional regulator
VGRPSQAEQESRPPLTRERVLRVALALTDEGGLDGLTMRELGRRLGVEAMSLYNHVANKDDVLDGMLDLVVEEIELPSGDVDWRQAMLRRAASARAAFARHPWASALIDSRETSGPARMLYFEWVIGTLRRAGFSVALAVHGYSAIDSYVYGFGRQELNMSGGAGAGEVDHEVMAEAFLAQIPEAQFPYLREVITEFMFKTGYDEDTDFAFGMGLILDGLERARDSAGPP